MLNQNDKKALAKRLHALGCTQTDIAKALQMTRATVHDWLNNTKKKPSNNLYTILKNKGWLSPNELADKYECSGNLIRELLRQGKINAKRINKQYLFDPENLPTRQSILKTAKHRDERHGKPEAIHPLVTVFVGSPETPDRVLVVRSENFQETLNQLPSLVELKVIGITRIQRQVGLYNLTDELQDFIDQACYGRFFQNP